MVKRKKNRLLDCAGTSTTVKPKDKIAETTMILIPVSTTITPTPPVERKIDGAKVGKGQTIVKVQSPPLLKPRYRAIAPKAVPNKVAAKIIVPWIQGISPIVAANCAPPAVLAALPKTTFGETSVGSVTPKLDSPQAVLCQLSTKSQVAMQPDSRLAQNDPSDEEQFTCFHCQYACRRKYDIRRHIINVHSPCHKSDAEALKCNLCWRSYSYKSALRRHLLRKHFSQSDNELSSTLAYSKSKPNYGYCCDICGRGYKKQCEMLAHRQVCHVTAQEMCWSAFQASEGKLEQCANCGGLFRMGHFFKKHSCFDNEENVVLEKRLQEVLCARPSFRCDICSLSFRWKLILRLHREMTHLEAISLDWNAVNAVEVPNYCGSCLMAFDGETKVVEHRCVKVEPEEKRKLHICQLCGISYRRKSDYLQHRRLKHVTADQDGCQSREAERRKPAFQCPYCDKSVMMRSEILTHIKETHDIEVESPFLCPLCNKVFKHKVTLDTHNQTYHPKDENASENERILRETQILVNGEPAYRCSQCNRNWFDEIRFLAHHRLHLAERKFTCDLCGKQMRTQHHLNQHVKIIHLDIRNYTCDICQKSFHTKQSCDQHRRIHTGERPYACEICGKTFVSLNALISHKRIHNDFYPHSCHLCPKKFKVRRSLVHHIRRHTGERPFQCEICSKTFNNSSLFSYHLKVTHSDNRPFKCEQCGSRFKANRFLQRHLKLHETRTHIQFKRRNNPEYFAAQDAAATTKNVTGVEEAPVELDSKDDNEVSTVQNSLAAVI